MSKLLFMSKKFFDFGCVLCDSEDQTISCWMLNIVAGLGNAHLNLVETIGVKEAKLQLSHESDCHEVVEAIGSFDYYDFPSLA